MRFYELVYLISDNAEKPDKLYQEINEFIEKKGGKINKIIPLNEVDLAYSIRKGTKAILASLDFYIESDKLNDLKDKIKSLSLSSRTRQDKSPILRSLIIRKEPPKETKITRRKIIKEKLLNKEEPKPKSKKIKKVELKEVNQKIEEILKG